MIVKNSTNIHETNNHQASHLNSLKIKHDHGYICKWLQTHEQLWCTI